LLQQSLVCGGSVLKEQRMLAAATQCHSQLLRDT
jgi:hypothetical protein